MKRERPELHEKVIRNNRMVEINEDLIAISPHIISAPEKNNTITQHGLGVVRAGRISLNIFHRCTVALTVII